MTISVATSSELQYITYKKNLVTVWLPRRDAFARIMKFTHESEPANLEKVVRGKEEQRDAVSDRLQVCDRLIVPRRREEHQPGVTHCAEHLERHRVRRLDDQKRAQMDAEPEHRRCYEELRLAVNEREGVRPVGGQRRLGQLHEHRGGAEP